MRPNLLLILSDQHGPRCAGFAGHPIVRTPHLDDLAAGGTTFAAAYCASPICVPARASIATGRYVHQHGCWDNAAPYAGDPPSWGHRLLRAGYDVASVGKLHYRDADADTGAGRQVLPMHVHGRGDLRGLVRRSTGIRVPAGTGSARISRAGTGHSEYTAYDRAVADAAVQQIRDADPAAPFAITVSFVSPHFPWLAPPEYARWYFDAAVEVQDEPDSAWQHPSVQAFREAFGLGPLKPGAAERALRAYYGLCSFLDEQVGRVLAALRASGRDRDTLVVYTSDHGESAGAHGLWFKHLMNEESAGVPMIISGPGVPAGHLVRTPASHVDLYPTILWWAGESDRAAESPGTHGVSLLELAGGHRPDRTVLSEYHANGSTSAAFLVRDERYKYIHHVGDRPQLFDLIADPGEHADLAADPAHAPTRARLADALRGYCDPEAVDDAAKQDQRCRIEAAGGVTAALAHTVEYTPAPLASPPPGDGDRPTATIAPAGDPK